MTQRKEVSCLQKVISNIQKGVLSRRHQQTSNFQRTINSQRELYLSTGQQVICLWRDEHLETALDHIEGGVLRPQHRLAIQLE